MRLTVNGERARAPQPAAHAAAARAARGARHHEPQGRLPAGRLRRVHGARRRRGAALVPPAARRGRRRRRSPPSRGSAQHDDLSPVQAAFDEHYAAQCGFCTSGMMMAAHASSTHSRRRRREDILEALGGHVCRCTGYVKIVDAVEAAARGRRSTPRGRRRASSPSEAEVADPGSRHEGRRRTPAALRRRRARHRRDACTSTTSACRGMLWAKALRSPHHNAAITRLDTSKAEALPGVHAVVTHKDVPARTSTATSRRSACPPTSRCWPTDEVRYKGQPIAAVAADERGRRAARPSTRSRSTTRSASRFFDIRKAFDPDAPQIHPWGNRCIRTSSPYNDRRDAQGRHRRGVRRRRDVIVQGVYRPAAIEHCPLETQVALVVPEASGRLTIYSCTQAMYFSMGVVAAHLQLPLNKLKFVGGTVGGGFGGKVDTASRDDLRAARAQGRAAGQVALDARGGVPRLLDARPVAHGDRRRGDERRLDPRPQDADAARRRRLRALLALRRDEARVPPHRRVHDPERRISTASSCSRTACRRRRCAASASPRCRSPSRCT